ncbi:MAG: M48 family metallopeptidase [Burkholderiales bacterium]
MQLDLFAPFEFLRKVLREPEPAAAPPPAKKEAKPSSKKLAEKPLSESRVARLGGQEIPYLLKRSTQRRRVGLQVDDRGLVVQAPWRSTDRHIERVLQDGASWIQKKLASWRANAPPARSWQSGDLVDYLGQQLTLDIKEEQERAQVLLMDNHRLEVRLPGPAQPSDVKIALAKWYKRHAQGHFPQRLDYYAAQLNLRKMPRLFVSSATTRWGSCNAQREIRLSWRLMQAAPPVIDYVVAHEVAHIIEMNHSPKFWSVVEKLCPGYAGARAELNALTRHYMSL